jgi:hypothetical protein
MSIEAETVRQHNDLVSWNSAPNQDGLIVVVGDIDEVCLRECDVRAPKVPPAFAAFAKAEKERMRARFPRLVNGHANVGEMVDQQYRSCDKQGSRWKVTPGERQLALPVIHDVILGCVRPQEST